MNVGDFKPADIAIDAYARFAWAPEAWGADAQTRFLEGWARRFLGASQVSLAQRVAAHLSEYYRLGTIRKPELMCRQWIAKLTDAEKAALAADYAALAREDAAIEALLAPGWRDSWYEAVGYQARFMSEAGLAFMASDALEESACERQKRAPSPWRKPHSDCSGRSWRCSRPSRPARRGA